MIVSHCVLVHSLTHASDETAEGPYDDCRGHRAGPVENSARGDEDARADHDTHDEGQAADQTHLPPKAVPVTMRDSRASPYGT